jgi:uncharacterized protein YjcR
MSASISPIPPAMAWASDQEATNGYKRDDCVWNLASNELQAQGSGGENDPSKVQARVAQLVSAYNAAVASGDLHGSAPIANPNVVTVAQLGTMENLDPATSEASSPVGPDRLPAS